MENPTGQILILDDDPDWSRTLERGLTKSGYEVDLVSNVEEAIAKLMRKFYHLVVIDLNLHDPQPDNQEGLLILRWIVNMNEATQGLVVTGFATPQLVRDILKEEKAFDFVEKPEYRRVKEKIDQGVAAAKGLMIAHPMNPVLRLKGIGPWVADKKFGISPDKALNLFKSAIFMKRELFTKPVEFDNQNLQDEIVDGNKLGDLPKILEDKYPATLIERSGTPVISIRIWDRLGGQPLRVRISKRAQIAEEYDFFSGRPDSLMGIGFRKISFPLWQDDLGAIIYEEDETEHLFAQFEFPAVSMSN